MTGTVLITGATGFLGAQLVRQFITQTDFTIIALVRANGDEEAARRLSRAWWDWPELERAIGERVELVRGDITTPWLGLDPSVIANLTRRLTHIVHAAANLDLHGPLEELRRVNVDGTRYVLEIARAAHRDHGLARLCHVSTAYVASRRRSVVREQDFAEANRDGTPYERSKREGERLVRGAGSALPVTILRPGMIVGDSRTGEIKTFNTVYAPLRLYLMNRLRVIPVSPDLRVNLVPVDYVAQTAVRLCLDGRAEGLAFHLTAPWPSLPTASQLTDATRIWARETLGVKLPRPLFLPLPLPKQAGTGRGRGALGVLRALAPYLNDRRRFLRDNVDRLVGPYPLDWRVFLPRLLSYAAAAGFFHRSERTVHEQLLFRLGGRSHPVTLHDVFDGTVHRRSAREVRDEAMRAAGALQAAGIKKGDRVAWVGHNSTRLLCLDVAIGLLGAVSVPLYYTSPPREIDGILASSGARLLLIGAPGVLARVGELRSDVPVVSFCRDPVPDGGFRSILAWEDFLAKGDHEQVPGRAPVTFGDLATLRYTSGTTGCPKGVPFHHGNLRFMAESLVSLMPWRARTRRIVTLSFLPMNHVVEGILATYAPYYAPSRLDLFFLEDFRALANVLPKVRPTFFFSVPRFYEKLWEGVLGMPFARTLVQGRGSGRAVRRLVGRLVLRRAGLDRCAQLIVGSAPARADVLGGLERLGIVVHNAYGLTEAPLVTMNRSGRNRPGTVGEPLPQTEVRVAPDGEILVRGPQVTSGGTAEGALAVRDGWLTTGDLGQLDEAGYLVISGRKKELIVTSYGKNVCPEKVEALLRGITGVREALLIGEGEAYCTGLLWVNDPGPDEGTLRAIDRVIVALNDDLSHPECIRAWAVLDDDLSIERGDLTANLKLRRRAVMAHNEDVISALYGRGAVPDRVRHIGRVTRAV